MNKIEFAGKRSGEIFSVTEENIDEIVEEMQRSGMTLRVSSVNLSEYPPEWLSGDMTKMTENDKTFDRLITKKLKEK